MITQGPAPLLLQPAPLLKGQLLLLTVSVLSLAGLLSLFRGGVRMQVVSPVPSGLYSVVSSTLLKSSTVSLHSSWHQVGSTWHIFIGAVTPQW